MGGAAAERQKHGVAGGSSRYQSDKIRWSWRLKLKVLEALAAGGDWETLKAEHGISEEELAEWERGYAKAGGKGLRVTRRAVLVSGRVRGRRSGGSGSGF